MEAPRNYARMGTSSEKQEKTLEGRIQGMKHYFNYLLSKRQIQTGEKIEIKHCTVQNIQKFGTFLFEQKKATGDKGFYAVDSALQFLSGAFNSLKASFEESDELVNKLMFKTTDWYEKVREDLLDKIGRRCIKAEEIVHKSPPPLGRELLKRTNLELYKLNSAYGTEMAARNAYNSFEYVS